eukprot:985928-Rhodomonas_salina.2
MERRDGMGRRAVHWAALSGSREAVKVRRAQLSVDRTPSDGFVLLLLTLTLMMRMVLMMRMLAGSLMPFEVWSLEL